MAYMVNRDAPYSGLATLMNMRDNNPNTQLAYVPTRDVEMRYDTIYNPSTGIPQAVGVSSFNEGGAIGSAPPVPEAEYMDKLGELQEKLLSTLPRPARPNFNAPSPLAMTPMPIFDSSYTPPQGGRGAGKGPAGQTGTGPVITGLPDGLVVDRFPPSMPIHPDMVTAQIEPHPVLPTPSMPTTPSMSTTPSMPTPTTPSMPTPINLNAVGDLKNLIDSRQPVTTQPAIPAPTPTMPTPSMPSYPMPTLPNQPPSGQFPSAVDNKWVSTPYPALPNLNKSSYDPYLSLDKPVYDQYGYVQSGYEGGYRPPTNNNNTNNLTGLTGMGGGLAGIMGHRAAGGSVASKADEVASYGRYGDTTLVHMTPSEVSGLASLGQLTINPDTGLPEAFSLGSIVPMVANIALGMATGGMSVPMQMSVMGGVNLFMGLAQGQDFGDALLGAALSAGSTGIMRGLGSGLFSGAASGGADAAAGAVTDAAAGTGFTDALGNFVHTATPEAALAGTSSLPSFSGPEAMGLDLGGFGYTGAEDAIQPLSTMGGDASVVKNTPSFLSNVTDYIKDNPIKTTLGLAGLGSAFFGEEPEQLDNEPTIAPRKPLEFTGHEAKGPFTEQQLIDLALKGETFDEDGNPINYDLFTSGKGPDGSWYVSKNEGGLVGIPQTKQGSNVTNYMFDKKQGAVSPFNIFEVGKGLGSMGKKNNSTLMQLAIGGQPRSNVADMITPMSRPVEFPRMISPSVFSYDNLLKRAAEKEEVEGFESPDAYQKRHEEILERLIEDMKKISTILPEEEEPVVAAPEPLIEQPDDSTFADGNPDAADEEDAADAAAAAAEAAEAAAEAEAEGVDEASSGDEWAKGGLIGLSKGGKLKPFSNATIELLRKAMLQRESSGNYSLRNWKNYVGGYQFGAAALEDLGYIKRGKSSKFGNRAMDNPDNWTGKNGITDLNSFYKDTDLQDKLFKKYAELNYKELKNKGVFKKDSSPEHVAGMLAASHLLGATGASKDLSATDANNVTGHEYYNLGKKSIEPALNLPSIKGEHERIARQRKSEMKNVPKEPSQDSSLGLLEMLQNLFTSQDDNTNTITIPKGATLSGLARKHNTTVDAIMQLNKIKNPDIIPAGGTLIIPRYQGGSVNPYFEGQVMGKGDGQSDQILFEVEGKNPDMALLSRDEYVLPADAVAMLGNGSSNAGAKELDQFVKNLRQQSFGTQQQQKRLNPQKGLSALV